MPKFEKGSEESKAHMKSLRELRKSKKAIEVFEEPIEVIEEPIKAIEVIEEIISPIKTRKQRAKKEKVQPIEKAYDPDKFTVSLN